MSENNSPINTSNANSSEHNVGASESGAQLNSTESTTSVASPQLTSSGNVSTSATEHDSVTDSVNHGSDNGEKSFVEVDQSVTEDVSADTTAHNQAISSSASEENKDSVHHSHNAPQAQNNEIEQQEKNSKNESQTESQPESQPESESETPTGASNDNDSKQQDSNAPETPKADEDNHNSSQQKIQAQNDDQQNDGDNNDDDEDYDPANFGQSSDNEQETQKDDFDNEQSEKSDDEYDIDSAFVEDEDENVAQSASEKASEQNTENTTGNPNNTANIMKYVLDLPFLNHSSFLGMPDDSKKQFITDYINNPNDPKFDEYKTTNDNLKAKGKQYDETDRDGSQEALHKAKNPDCKRPDLSSPMSYDELANYGEFVRREAQYLTSGNWEQFPVGSRLFIGNLPVNTVNKQDLWRIFKEYGEVIQISIKSGYGFCQFRDVDQCTSAIRGESNVPLRGKIMHLEVSKPQKARVPIPGSTSSFTDGSLNSNIDSGNANTNRSKLNSFNSSNNSGTYEYTPLSGKRNNNRHHENYKRNHDQNNSFQNKRQRHDTSGNNRGGSRYERNNYGFQPNAECQIYVKKAASSVMVDQLASRLRSSGIVININDVVPQKSLKSLINEAAYAGVNGVIIIHRDGNLDVQIFQKTNDGGVKFDEYQAVAVDVAVELFVRARKFSRGSGSFGHGHGRDHNRNNNNSSSNNNNSSNNIHNTGYRNNNSFTAGGYGRKNSSFGSNFSSFEENNPAGFNTGFSAPGNTNPNDIPVGSRQSSYQRGYQNQNNYPNAAPYMQPQQQHVLPQFQAPQQFQQSPPPQPQQFQQAPQINPSVLQTLSSFDQNSLQSLLSLVSQVQPNSQPTQPQQALPQPVPSFASPPQYQQPIPQQVPQQVQQQPQQVPQQNQSQYSNNNSNPDANNIQSLMQTLQRLQQN